MAAELGETKDPKELIPGEAGNLENAAQSLRKRSGTFEDVGQGLGAVRIPGWTGQASDRFWEEFSGEKKNWLYAADSMTDAAAAVSKYAGVLSSAQQQAREAIALWDSGNHDHAQEILKNARQQVRDEGDAAKDKLKDLAGGASDAPDWLQRANKNAEQAKESGKSKLGKDFYDNPLVPDEKKRQFGAGPQGDPAAGPTKKTGSEAKLWERSADTEAWKAEAEGATQFGDHGKLTGKAELKLLGADGTVGAGVVDGNLEAKASGSAYLARASAEGSVEYGPAAASGKAEGFVGAQAEAKASVGRDGVHAGVEAFAGAKATAEGHADVGGIGAGGSAEAWAGIGAEANVDVGMKGGKFVVGGEFGAALGVGGKLSGQIEIDPQKVADTVSDVSDAVGDGLDAVGDGLKSLNPFG